MREYVPLGVSFLGVVLNIIGVAFIALNVTTGRGSAGTVAILWYYALYHLITAAIQSYAVYTRTYEKYRYALVLLIAIGMCYVPEDVQPALQNIQKFNTAKDTGFVSVSLDTLLMGAQLKVAGLILYAFGQLPLLVAFGSDANSWVQRNFFQ